ncbi:uncharacterized protein TNCT_587401, partial [Trichonephila clavata]
NIHKSSGQRNQWTTWILRTPCSGVKLLWQAMITNQLSKYSAEALKHGKKTSFVHAKSSLVLRGVLPKRTSRYEESSFVTCVPGPRALGAYSKRPVHSDSTLTATSKNSVEENSYSLEENSSKFEDDKLKSFKLDKKSKDGSYFSLTENVTGKESKRKGVVRSKSFGNDFKDSIPFIDCVDENNSGTESNIIYIREYKPQNGCSDNNALEMKVVNSERLEEVEGCAKSNLSESAPGTPKTTDKLIQTDESNETASLGKRTPKKKFPRLGTFERIKIEGRQTISEDNNATRTCGTRTGTTAKHRRQPTSTVSKEQLLKSDSTSPILETKPIKELSHSVHRKPQTGFFGRFWKKDTEKKELNSRSIQSIESTLKIKNDAPPDYEASLSLPGTSHVSLN